jgi:ATP/maltotriose-dependent transcriptional regulator MalT
VWARIGQPTRAEALANSIPDLDRQAVALALLVKVVAAGSDHDRAARLAGEAEALTEQITWGRRAWALARLLEAVAAGGDHDRAARLAGEAEALTEQITDPDMRVKVLAQLAGILMKTSKETSRVPRQARSSSPLMVRARRLLAEALAAGSWTGVVSSLACVDPLAVTALADEVQARWGPSAQDRRH